MQYFLCVMFALLCDIFLCRAASNMNKEEELPWQPFPVTPMQSQFLQSVQTIDPKKLEKKVQIPKKEKTQNRPYQCEQCARKFVRLSHLQRHLLSHTSLKPHLCPSPGCNFRTRRFDNLSQHMRIHNPKDPCVHVRPKKKVVGLKIKETSEDVSGT